MKKFLLLAALVTLTAPLFANDEGGDGAYIPPIAELMHEGYGSPMIVDPYDLNNAVNSVMLESRKVGAKPTQAYYDAERHRTIYYGFKPVPLYRVDPSTLYAFGYPLDFFRALLPPSIESTNLETAAVAVYNSRVYSHDEPVTAVHKVPAKTGDQ